VNGLHNQQQQQQHLGLGMGQQWPMGQIPAHAGIGSAGGMGGPGVGMGTFGGIAGGSIPGLGSLSGSSTSGSGLHKGGSLQGVGVAGGAHNNNSGSGVWAGHDDVSNLMRQVGHGGKYDPAFDFVADEFKTGGKR
jgi:hypothetical protein